MQRTILFTLLVASGLAHGQVAVQSVNSGALTTASSSVSVGEIVVVPANPDQAASGTIASLAQTSQLLEVPELGLAQNVTAFPNPAAGQIFFGGENLSGQNVRVFNASGQEVSEQTVSSANAIDLQSLSSGIYLIRFDDQKIKSFKIIKH